jgi:sugar phosphate isomerase/epimerase
MRIAFSTVAFPTRTLEYVADVAEVGGYQGVELRTLGFAGTRLACDPALTAPQKTLTLLSRAGAEPCVLASSVSYDEPIVPPVIGYVISDHERSVRETKGLVGLARQLECPFVRVFAFQVPDGERRKSAIARIVSRLKSATDTCRNSGVRLLLENGGSFNTAVELAEIIDRVDSPLLAAAYSVPVGIAAGEDPLRGMNALGDRLRVVKLKDLKNGKPCELGTGDQPCRDVVTNLARVGFDGWVVYEHDQIWLSPGGDARELVLAGGRSLTSWSGSQIAAATRKPGLIPA